MNSLEKVLDSTVFWCLLYHTMGARFTNNMNPVWDQRVILLAACDASTKAVVSTGRPLASGNMCGGGSSYSTSRY